MAITVGLIVFNLTLLDYDNLMEGDSLVGLIGIVSAFCALCILIIFRMSKSIEEKTKN